MVTNNKEIDSEFIGNKETLDEKFEIDEILKEELRIQQEQEMDNELMQKYGSEVLFI
jgi:hypothetical protein